MDPRRRVRRWVWRIARNGRDGVAKQGVVLVSLNYRLGRFGFFAFPALSREHPDENKGNYAYMDQIAALQWIKRNIAAFGGDPGNVTIFGFSAGGVSVHSLLASPQAAGAPPSGPPIETTPILDGRLITETAETAYKAKHHPRVPLLAGSNSADTAGNRIKATTKDELFARYGKWSAQAKAAYDPDGSTEINTLIARANDDFGQAEPARFAASAFASNGSPAYLYRFAYVATARREQMRAGTPHGGEIGFVFGTLVMIPRRT